MNAQTLAKRLVKQRERELLRAEKRHELAKRRYTKAQLHANELLKLAQQSDGKRDDAEMLLRSAQQSLRGLPPKPRAEPKKKRATKKRAATAEPKKKRTTKKRSTKKRGAKKR